MRPNLSRALVLATCALAGLAGCDSGGNASPNTLGTVPPTASTPDPTDTDGTGEVGSTLAPTSSVGSLPPGAIELAADGPWRRVDSAPGITQPGLVYELMPGLWVWLPTEEDIPNGITWVLNEADLPIIEAYLQARLVYFQSITSDPIDLDHPGWDQWYSDGGAAYAATLTSRKAQGQVADLSVGVVLRPTVMGEARTEGSAIVADCMLDGGVFRMPDGSLADGSAPGVAPYGSAALLTATDEVWVIAQISEQPESC